MRPSRYSHRAASVDHRRQGRDKGGREAREFRWVVVILLMALPRCGHYTGDELTFRRSRKKGRVSIDTAEKPKGDGLGVRRQHPGDGLTVVGRHSVALRDRCRGARRGRNLPDSALRAVFARFRCGADW